MRTNKRLQALEDAAARTAKLIIRNEDVRVVIAARDDSARRGHPASYNWRSKILSLPSFPDTKDPRVADAFRGLIDHETGHVLHTDFAVADSKVKRWEREHGSNAVRILNIWNAFEDIFMESRVLHHNRRADRHFRALYDFYSDIMPGEPAAWTDPEFTPMEGGQPLGVLGAFVQGVLMVGHPLIKLPIEDVHPDTRALIELCEEPIKRGWAAKSTGDAMRAAEEIWALLQDPPEPEPEEDDGDGEDSEGDDSGDDSGSGSDAGEEGEDSDTGSGPGSEDGPDAPLEDSKGSGAGEDGSEAPEEPGEGSQGASEGEEDQDTSEGAEDADGRSGGPDGGSESGGESEPREGGVGPSEPGDGGDAADEDPRPSYAWGKSENKATPDTTKLAADATGGEFGTLVSPTEALISEIGESSAAYTVSPTAYSADRWEGYSADQKRKGLEQIRTIEKAAGPHSKKLQAVLRRTMQAATQKLRVGGMEEGDELDDDALTAIATRSHGRDLFMQTFQKIAKSVYVEVVVDCSGSMGHSPYYGCERHPYDPWISHTRQCSDCGPRWDTKASHAKITATALHKALKGLRIPHSVVGYTTRRVSDPVPGYGRYRNGVLMKEFVDAPGIYDNGGGLAYINGYSENCDADSIMMAAKHAAQNAGTADRVIMLVIADGLPSGADCDSEVEYAALVDTVERVAHAGIEVYGVGVSLGRSYENFRRFYPDNPGGRGRAPTGNLKLDDADVMNDEVIREFTRILTYGVGSTRRRR